MKIKRVMAGIFAAVICSSMTLIPQTVEAFYSVSAVQDIDFICGSSRVQDGATAVVTFEEGTLELYVSVPDDVAEAYTMQYCFGGIYATNPNSYALQSGGEVETASMGNAEMLYYQNSNDLFRQNAFSLYYDQWAVGDSLYFGDYCYTLDNNMDIQITRTYGETSLGNVFGNESQTEPLATEPVFEETLPNPTAPWLVTEPATETAAQMDAASAFETTATTEAVIATEPVSVTEAIETLPTPTMPLETYYETPETVFETTSADPLLFFNRDWLVYIDLETLGSSRKDYCWDLDSRAVLGDADCDGSVTLVDAVVLARFLTENGQMPVGGIMNTDFNESGAPDLKDAVNLMRYACGDMTEQELMETSPFARHLPC